MGGKETAMEKDPIFDTTMEDLRAMAWPDREADYKNFIRILKEHGGSMKIFDDVKMACDGKVTFSLNPVLIDVNKYFKLKYPDKVGTLYLTKLLIELNSFKL